MSITYYEVLLTSVNHLCENNNLSKEHIGGTEHNLLPEETRTSRTLKIICHIIRYLNLKLLLWDNF